MKIDTLCDYWDDCIRVFTIINGKSETIHKLKYNIVQLIVYSGDLQLFHADHQCGWIFLRDKLHGSCRNTEQHRTGS